MKTLLFYLLMLVPLLVFSQSKSLVSSGGDLIDADYQLSISLGQVFVQQVKADYSFSEGFQQYHPLREFTANSLDFSVTPNPTADLISVTSQSEIQAIRIFDADGTVIKSSNAKGIFHEVSMRDLPTGVYFVSATTIDDKNYIKKIIKL